jgi:hypothetical protein
MSGQHAADGHSSGDHIIYTNYVVCDEHYRKCADTESKARGAVSVLLYASMHLCMLL